LNVVLLDQRKLAFQIFAQQTHQEIHLGLRPAPIFERKSVERKTRNVQLRAGFNHHAGSLYARAMAGEPRQMAALRPSPVAIHDRRDVLGKPVRVQLLQKRGFFVVRGFERFELFHGE